MLNKKQKKVDIHFKAPVDVRRMLLALSKELNRTYTEILVALIIQEYEGQKRVRKVS